MGQMCGSGLLAKSKEETKTVLGRVKVNSVKHLVTQQSNVGHLIEVKVIRCTGILQANGRLSCLYLNDVRVPAVEHHAHETRLAAKRRNQDTLGKKPKQKQATGTGDLLCGSLTSPWYSVQRPSFRWRSVCLSARKGLVSPCSRWA